MIKRLEQRSYNNDQLIDSFRPADLVGLSDWLLTAEVGGRYERFTGQTYLIVVE